MRIIALGLYLLSLGGLWGAGYWLFQQGQATLLQEQQRDVQILNERAEAVLLRWQQDYQVHLHYLQQDLANVTPLNTDSLLYDPWQELTDKIRQTLWPTPLLAFSWLDQQGRVLQQSDVRVSQWLAQAQVPDIEVGREQVHFGEPQWYYEQWLMPMYLPFSQGQLVLWVSLEPLQNQLQQLLAANPYAAWYFVAPDSRLVSPTPAKQRLWSLLQPQLQNTERPLPFAFKRPPVDLTKATLHFDSTAAWPETELMAEMRARSAGVQSSYQLNFLGRNALAAWRWQKDWQLFLVAELDVERDHRAFKAKSAKMLAVLLAVTLLLTAGFIWLWRQLAEANPRDDQFEPIPALPANADSFDEALQEAEAQQLQRVPQVLQAQSLLHAWLQSQPPKSELSELTRSWLQQQPFYQDPLPLYSLPLHSAVWALVHQVQQQYPLLECTLEFDPELPQWVLIPWPVVASFIRQAMLEFIQHDATMPMHVAVRAMPMQQLQLAITTEHMQLPAVLAALVQDSSASSSEPNAWDDLKQQLQQIRGHLELSYQPTGLQLTVAMQPLTRAMQESELQLVDGVAMVLSPPGSQQRVLTRVLRQTGLSLVPLDDPTQFVQWCSEQSNQPLDYVVLDERFVQQDTQVAQQLFQIIRRYFPETTLVMVVAQPDAWASLMSSFELLLVPRPVLAQPLQQALQAHQAGVFMLHQRRVWLAEADSLQAWSTRLMLEAQGYQVCLLNDLADVTSAHSEDALIIPIQQRALLPDRVDDRRVVWSCSQSTMLDPSGHHRNIWQMELGAVELSHALYHVFRKDLG